MPKLVVLGATLRCSSGTTSSTLAVAVPHGAEGELAAAASIDDHVPMVNVPPFGACSAPTNPQVAAATSAAGGVLTPQPCVPVIAAPWAPGAPAITVGTRPALTDASTCTCTWTGTITIVDGGSSVELSV